MMNSQKNNINILEEYVNKEDVPSDYTSELSFYSIVKNGDISAVKAHFQDCDLDNSWSTRLSKDIIQSSKYHFVVTAALLARCCIEGGMTHKQAYEISDNFINRADEQKTFNGLHLLLEKMCITYAKEMDKFNKIEVYSKPVVECINYISSHLHCRITVKELAELVNLNESYLSHCFKEQTNVSISRYILQKKINVSENLLRFSEYSCAEIGELLAFSSQSHFTFSFKNIIGMTPKVYRNKFYNNIGLSTE